MEKKITEVEVVDVEKRRNPSKHYVYIITVDWQDGSRHSIYRRYSRFFDLQCNLGDMFPLEAGYLNPLERIIPFLPGKILFGRSQIREVAMKRLIQLDEYLKALIKLPSKISECEKVLDFFDAEPDDLSPPMQDLQKKTSTSKAKNISEPKLMEHYVAVGTYEKQEKGELELQEGDVVEVLEKNHSGWWFVQIDQQQGWVPSTYLQSEDGPNDSSLTRVNPGDEERYICTESYDPAGEDELRLEKGVFVDVVEKNLKGWWLVRHKGEEGWAPATYLMEANLLNTQNKAKQSGVEIVSNLKDISELLNPSENRRESRVDLESALFHQQIKKNRSLQRGGSIRPPPRQTSIKSKSSDKSNSLTRKTYETVADFEDNVGDGISFCQGEPVTVLEKSDSGWWYVEIRGKDGWAPSTYIGEKGSGVEIDEIYDRISSPDTSDYDEDWEQIDYTIVSKNNNTDNVYDEIDKIFPSVSPKLLHKSFPVSKKNSHPMDKSNFAPYPNVPQDDSQITTTESNRRPDTSAANFRSASAIVGALKTRIKKKKHSPPLPQSQKKLLLSSQCDRASSDNFSVSKPVFSPDKNKPQFCDKILKTESSNKPPPPLDINKQQMCKHLSFDKTMTSETSNKPLLPPNMNKPQLKTNKLSEHVESKTRKSVDVPQTGIANALKCMFENQQKANTECSVPQRVKSPIGSQTSATSNSLKSELEQRQKVMEAHHGTEVLEPLFKSKGYIPPKPAVIKQDSGIQAIKSHQFTPKPLTHVGRASSPSKPQQLPLRPPTHVGKASSPSKPQQLPLKPPTHVGKANSPSKPQQLTLKPLTHVGKASSPSKPQQLTLKPPTHVGKASSPSKPQQLTLKPLTHVGKASSPSKPQQLTLKPLTESKSCPPPKTDSNSMRTLGKSSELPKDNIASSLKSKFEAGFGNSQSSSSSSAFSKPNFKPVSSDTPKTFVNQNLRENSSSSKKSEISSNHRHSRTDSENEEQHPCKGSAASLRVIFESSDKKGDQSRPLTSVSSMSKPPALTPKPAALRKHSFDQNRSKIKSTDKPVLPQKNKKWSQPEQKENKLSGTNVNIANIHLKSKLDFGGSSPLSTTEKIETRETAETTSQQLESNPGSVVMQSKDSDMYVTVADFTSGDTDGISFKAGMEVTVIEKTEGWWWICIGQKKGWAPETYLQPSGTQNGDSPSDIMYRVICNFEAANDGEVPLTEGTNIEVIEKSDQWWFVRTDAGEGWVPGNYVQQV